mmetsp:Transcript_5369/g.7965  ORF Transcript_5369/g.7965 Transcript_5369/m.7965 type:complete len:81 (-) Transcript_5369:399-641(-)
MSVSESVSVSVFMSVFLSVSVSKSVSASMSVSDSVFLSLLCWRVRRQFARDRAFLEFELKGGRDVGMSKLALRFEIGEGL